MVLGLNHAENINIVRTFRDQFGITFPILLDGQQYGVYNQPGQSPFPLDYVIDRNGNVAYFNTEYDPVTMLAIVDSLIDPATLIDDEISENRLPREFKMLGNYPNPFNSSTIISFVAPAQEFVTIEVFDLLGRKISKIYDGLIGPGEVSIGWDISAEDKKLNSGIYFYRITAGQRSVSGKMVYLK